MNPSLTGPLPNPTYLRILEYQRQRMAYPSYSVDRPLLFFILFSRIAAGLAIFSPFFPPSFLWMGMAFCLMVLATGASITHLTIPSRFLAMILNHRSPIVWEVRLAGALTGSLGAQILSHLGMLPGFESFIPWISFFLSILFLLATGWAYQFHTHPAWKTDLLPGLYLISATMIGFAFYSFSYPNPYFGGFILVLIGAQSLLISLYLNYLRKASHISLRRMASGKERILSFAFLMSNLILPLFLVSASFFMENLELLSLPLALSSIIGVLFERILFFRLEHPIFFLSKS